jgi:hypothetical protein
MTLNQTRLKEVLHYDPLTGVFTRVKTGKVCGTTRYDGCVQMGVDGMLYRAARLAWLYVSGEWPEHVVDHINGNPGDNRIANLRAATVAENRQNSRIKNQNRTGYKGVQCERPGCYSARITFGGKMIRLGTFRTPDDAHRAYCEAASKHFGQFSNTGGVPCP